MKRILGFRLPRKKKKRLKKFLLKTVYEFQNGIVSVKFLDSLYKISQNQNNETNL